jgi:outer membrane protein TolC
MELLRLVGLPVGADLVEFEGRMDSFGLDGFNMEGMIDLSLAQSSELALAEALVAEGQRTLDQLRYEYIPDLRFKGGYQDKYGKVGTEVTNENDTWGLDLFGQPQTPSSQTPHGQSLGLYGSEVGLSGPEPGWFAGLQMRIPIFSGRARQGRRIEVRAALASFKAALDDQRDRVELNVRQNYKFLSEQQFQVQLAQEYVNIEKERFSIKEQLRDVGKITDDELETFRRSFFAAQDNLFSEQEIMIQRQEDLRLAIRYFK